MEALLECVRDRVLSWQVEAGTECCLEWAPLVSDLKALDVGTICKQVSAIKEATWVGVNEKKRYILMILSFIL